MKHEGGKPPLLREYGSGWRSAKCGLREEGLRRRDGNVHRDSDVLGERGRDELRRFRRGTNGSRPVTENAVNRLTAGFLCATDAVPARIVWQRQAALVVVAIVRMRGRGRNRKRHKCEKSRTCNRPGPRAKPREHESAH